MTFKIDLNALCLFVLLASGIAFEDVHRMQKNKGNILCRNCGSDITLSDTVISKSSPKSRYSFNDTLFYKDDVLVQVFDTDLFFHYPLISFTYSTCVPTGEWEESTSWYPGYLWKPCVCPDCGAYIGFVFEPINPSSVEPSTTFYGLILSSLISEHFLNSLTEYSAYISD